MNILTIGIQQNVSYILDHFRDDDHHSITHLYSKDEALSTIKDNKQSWDWIIIQGHDDPGHWKSILCAVNANASNTPITVISSHIDGTRLKTPVCSMHDDGNGIKVSRCAMQNLLQDEKPPINIEIEDKPAPIVFEYHSPCR